MRTSHFLGGLVWSIVAVSGALGNPNLWITPVHSTGRPPAIVQHHTYTASINPVTKLSDWVRYRVHPSNFTCRDQPEREWARDHQASADWVLEPEDYQGMYAVHRLDRGHMAPLGSFKCHKYVQETNQMTNIMPQAHTLNRGPWRELESEVRRISQQVDEGVYVISGPIYSDTFKVVLPKADEAHRVPTAFWKVVLYIDQSTQELVVSGYLFPQHATQGRPDDYRVPIRRIESLTGWVFFEALPKSMQKELKH